MFSGANNRGIDIALGDGADFVLLLNNDTEVDPDFLDRMVHAAAGDPSVGMVGPKIYYYEPPDEIWYAGGIVSLWRGLIAHRGIRQRDRGQYDEPGDTGYITACAVLVSRPCIERVGVLDDEYFIYGEDVDWCYRARRAGFRVVYEPGARVWHKVSSSSGGQNVPGGMTPFKVRHKIRSMLMFFRRYASWYHWITIPFFMAGQFLAAAWMMIRSGNWAGIGAMFSAATRKKQ
jgi:GT2 family glycosyltransferase